MRLLNVETLQLEYFVNQRSTPEYAILSHTWGDEEATSQDFTKVPTRNLKGWVKIHKCCERVRSQGWKYVWVDTCCIDKSSSAELSEAINSMFEWYSNAEVCYAYLENVNGAGPHTMTVER